VKDTQTPPTSAAGPVMPNAPLSGVVPTKVGPVRSLTHEESKVATRILKLAGQAAYNRFVTDCLKDKRRAEEEYLPRPTATMDIQTPIQTSTASQPACIVQESKAHPNKDNQPATISAAGSRGSLYDELQADYDRRRLQKTNLEEDLEDRQKQKVKLEEELRCIGLEIQQKRGVLVQLTNYLAGQEISLSAFKESASVLAALDNSFTSSDVDIPTVNVLSPQSQPTPAVRSVSSKIRAPEKRTHSRNMHRLKCVHEILRNHKGGLTSGELYRAFEQTGTEPSLKKPAFEQSLYNWAQEKPVID